MGDKVEQSMQHVNLGRTKMERKDWKGAIEDFRRALKIDPRNPYAHRNLLSSYAALGMWGHASIHGHIFDNLVDQWHLRLDGLGEFQMTLGMVNLVRSQELHTLCGFKASHLLEKALNAFRKAYELAPEVPEIEAMWRKHKDSLPFYIREASPPGYIHFWLVDPVLEVDLAYLSAQKLFENLARRLTFQGLLLVATADADVSRPPKVIAQIDRLERLNGVLYARKKGGSSLDLSGNVEIAENSIREVRDAVLPADLIIGNPLHTVTYIRTNTQTYVIADPSVTVDGQATLLQDCWEALLKAEQKMNFTIHKCYFCGGSGSKLCESCEGLDAEDCSECRGRPDSTCVRCEGLGVTPPHLDRLPGSMIPKEFREHVMVLRASGRLASAAPVRKP